VEKYKSLSSHRW